jgi:hypothetical protein
LDTRVGAGPPSPSSATRAHHGGPVREGDRAWTPPTGSRRICRRPGSTGASHLGDRGEQACALWVRVGSDAGSGGFAAAQRVRGRPLRADLCALTLGSRYQAVTFRGVLNDMTTATERNAVLRAFAGALSDRGMLMLDVHQPDGSRRRADGVRRRRTADPLGARALSTWQHRHVGGRPPPRVADYQLRVPGAPAGHRRFTGHLWLP